MGSDLSKKVAAGSTPIVVDMHIGPTAKVWDAATARMLRDRLLFVGKEVGLEVAVVEANATQLLGRGIGPVLEARDVIGVLRGDRDVLAGLRARALLLARCILEFMGIASGGEGVSIVKPKPCLRVT